MPKIFLDDIRKDFRQHNLQVRVGKKEITDYIDSTDSSREEVVAYFIKKYGVGTGVNRSSEETIVISASAPSLSLSVGSNTFSSLQFTNIDVGKSRVLNDTQIYFNTLLQKTLAKEEKTLQLYKKGISSINNKQDILDFYTKKSSNAPQINLREYFSKLVSSYLEIEGIVPNTAENKAKITQTQNKIRNLSSVFTNKVIDEKLMGDPQFIAAYGIITGEILNNLNNNLTAISKNDIDQLKKSGTTILEFLENINISQLLSSIQSDPTNSIKSFEVKGVGSSQSKDFKNFLVNNINSTKPTSVEEYKTLYTSFVKNSIQSLLSKNKEVSIKNLLSLGVLTNQGEPDASGKIRDDVVDIDVVISLKDNSTILSKIDAKLGSEDRYKGSKVEFSAGKTINSIIDDITINNQNFKDLMTIIVLSFIANRITGQANEKFTKDIIFLMTYSILSSNWFAEKFGFRENIADQADFLAIRDTYIWFSDFLKFFIVKYLGSNSGRKPSVDISDAMNKAAPLITEIKNKNNLISTVEDLIKSSTDDNINNLLTNIKNLFLNSGVSFDPDFNGVLNSIK